MTKNLGPLFTLSGEAVLGIDDGVIQFANPAAEDIFGAGLAGSKASSLIPEHILAEPSDCFTATAVIRGRSISFSATRLDGSLLLSAGARTESSSIRLSGLLNTVQSALGTLRLASDRLVESLDADADPKLSAYSAALYHSYYILLREAHNLSDVISLADGNAPYMPGPADLCLLCSELIDTVNHFIRDTGLRVDFHCEAGDFRGALDKTRIEKLILNLLSNSLRRMGGGGVVSLYLERKADRFILTLSDSGGGMDAETLRKAFSQVGEEFSSRRFSIGAGFGLAVARGIAEQHDGAILLESREGLGTEVKVILPVTTENPARFLSAGTDYRYTGMNTVLTELSGILPSKYYNKRYFD